MTSSTRIEMIDSQSIVSVPFHIPAVFVPHVVLTAFIAFAWAADGVFELGRYLIGG